MVRRIFKLENTQNNVDTHETIENVKGIKIISCRYKTANTNNEILLVNIEGFNGGNMYVYKSGNITITRPYTKLIMLSDLNSALSIWEAPSTLEYDVLVQRTVDVKHLKIDLLINAEYTSDITSLNPLYIEIDFIQ